MGGGSGELALISTAPRDGRNDRRKRLTTARRRLLEYSKGNAHCNYL